MLDSSGAFLPSCGGFPGGIPINSFGPGQTPVEFAECAAKEADKDSIPAVVGQKDNFVLNTVLGNTFSSVAHTIHAAANRNAQDAFFNGIQFITRAGSTILAGATVAVTGNPQAGVVVSAGKFIYDGATFIKGQIHCW